jgi:hypothetical protein
MTLGLMVILGIWLSRCLRSLCELMRSVARTVARSMSSV